MAQRAEEGGVGGRDEGRGGVGVGDLRRRRAASPRRPAAALPPRGGRPHLRPPLSPSQDGNTALVWAKNRNNTEVVRLLLENAAVAAQVGSAPAPLFPRPTHPLCLHAVPASPHVGASPPCSCDALRADDCARRTRRIFARQRRRATSPPSNASWKRG